MYDQMYDRMYDQMYRKISSDILHHCTTICAGTARRLLQDSRFRSPAASGSLADSWWHLLRFSIWMVQNFRETLVKGRHAAAPEIDRILYFWTFWTFCWLDAAFLTLSNELLFEKKKTPLWRPLIFACRCQLARFPTKIGSCKLADEAVYWVYHSKKESAAFVEIKNTAIRVVL